MTRYHGNNVRHNMSSKEFEGTTPKIGGVLGLRRQNVTKKFSYDSFCENNWYLHHDIVQEWRTCH